MTNIIGITGLIASGKSTMVDYLRSKGLKVFDADFEVAKLYKNEQFLNKLKNIFPDAFKNDVLDKKYLRKIAFSDINIKTKLENLIHPIVEKKCDNFIKENVNEKIIFLDIPLLFEVNWDKKCNNIILIITNNQVQKQRFLERGGDGLMFDKILENQKSVDEKILKSDYIIDNDQSLKDFYKKIDEILLIL